MNVLYTSQSPHTLGLALYDNMTEVGYSPGFMSNPTHDWDPFCLRAGGSFLFQDQFSRFLTLRTSKALPLYKEKLKERLTSVSSSRGFCFRSLFVCNGGHRRALESLYQAARSSVFRSPSRLNSAASSASRPRNLRYNMRGCSLPPRESTSFLKASAVGWS